MGAALGWGVVAASSLVIGMLLGLARSWPGRLIGLVLAFGAGALISAVSFELFEEGIAVGGAAAVGIGLALGALVYFMLARVVERVSPGQSDEAAGGGSALALGAFLDGIPSSSCWGSGSLPARREHQPARGHLRLEPARGDRLGHGHEGVRDATSSIRLLWYGVAAVCALATPLGYLLADGAGGHFKAGVNGFAAGALLVMLVDSMIPEATSKSGRVAGLATTLGFAVAAGLSSATA